MKQGAVFNIVFFLVLVCLGALCIGCDQEPLFYDISIEYPPIKPLIGGAPSKIVEYGGNLYVTNGTIYIYSGTPRSWKRFTDGGNIGATIDVAATDNALYAVERGGTLKKYFGSGWGLVSISGMGKGHKVESIFGAGPDLLINVNNGGDVSGTMYDLYVSLSGVAPVPLKYYSDSKEIVTFSKITGVADTRVGTLGQGLFTYSSGTLDSVTLSSGSIDSDIVGLATDTTNIFVVTKSSVHRITGSAINGSIAAGSYSGAVAVWENGSDPLLLVGLRRSSGSFRYGYREIDIDSFSGLLSSSALHTPGSGSVTSVQGNSLYSAIGKHVVNHLWVVDGSAANNGGYPIIFASTAQDGLWSYKVREENKPPEWNGER